jgi:hypothetical protein
MAQIKKISRDELVERYPVDMTDHERAWRDSVDAKLDRILALLDKPAKAKQERPAEQFEKFWRAYGKKVQKKDCVALWKRKNLDPLIDVILKDIENRGAKCPRWSNGYKKDPIRYLRHEQWNDEIQQAKDQNVPQEVGALVRYAGKLGLEAKPGEPLDQFRARVIRELVGSEG